MKIKTIRIMAVAAIVIIFITSAITMAFSPKKNLKPSEYNLGTTYEMASVSKKPSIAIFYSDMCGYCIQSMPKYQALADIYKNKYNIVMINAEDANNIHILRDYAISSLPTLYIMDPSIDNRVYIPSFNNLERLRVEFDRYLRIRAMIK